MAAATPNYETAMSVSLTPFPLSRRARGMVRRCASFTLNLVVQYCNSTVVTVMSNQAKYRSFTSTPKLALMEGIRCERSTWNGSKPKVFFISVQSDIFLRIRCKVQGARCKKVSSDFLRLKDHFSILYTKIPDIICYIGWEDKYQSPMPALHSSPEAV
jgi:hypothetical protein